MSPWGFYGQAPALAMIHVKQGPSRPGVRARGGYQPDPQHRAALQHPRVAPGKAGHGGTAHRGGQERHRMDAAVMPDPACSAIIGPGSRGGWLRLVNAVAARTVKRFSPPRSQSPPEIRCQGSDAKDQGSGIRDQR